MSTEHYDVIIIGTGAGGGTLAYTLTGNRLNIFKRLKAQSQ
jgi:choline dehydrogenase-like flavoprotein